MVNKKSLATFVRTVGNQAIAGFKHFLNNVKIGGTLTINAETLTTPATSVLTLDGNNVVRSATAFAGISVDATSKIKHEVKAGVAINKGQAVYVTSADGTNMIVGLASNATEATSSKTMGLMETTVAINGKGNVITEGLLEGLDTSTATVGDPVWLGINGNLIYGIANKPSAPAHMVFIGIVTRVNANNGEIFVKVQNGFELEELHNVQISTPSTGQLIRRDSDNLWKNWTPNFLVPSNVSGTTNYISKFTGTNTIGNSQVFDNGTNVGISTASPQAPLHIGPLTGGNSTAQERLRISGDWLTTGSGSLIRFTNQIDSGTTPNAGEYNIAGIAGVDDNANWGGSLYFQTANTGTSGGSALTTKMVVSANGNVGIGTTSPSERLHVNGRIRVATIDNGTGDFLTVSATGVITDRTPAQVLTDIGAQPLLTNPVIGSGTSTRVAFWNNSNSISSSANLFWDNTNNRLGIGTSSPQQALHVNGISRFDSTIFIGPTATTGDIALELGQGRTGNGYAYIDLTGDTTYNDYGFRLIRNNTGANASSEILHRGTGDLNITTVNAANMRLLTGSTERLRITSGGNVGINNTSPSFTLDVSGDIRASSTLRSTSSVVRNYYVDNSGVPSSNLGNPTVPEMALFGSQFNNKTWFYDRTMFTFEYTNDGTTWITDSYSTNAIGDLVSGNNNNTFTIPRNCQKYRILIQNDGNYVYINALYMYFSTNGNNTAVRIFKRREDEVNWTNHTNSSTTVSSWPGHLYLPMNTIPWSRATTAGHYRYIMVEFTPNWVSPPPYDTTNINFYGLELWGGYPAARREIFTWDRDRRTYFPNTLQATSFASTVATGTAPFSVTSTTRVANLNVATAGTSDTWTTARTITIGNTGKSVNGSANVSWTLAEIGAYAATNPSGYTSNTGTVTSVAGTGGYGGLTLSGTVTSSGSITLGGTPTGTWPISTSGNAATATTLATARSINGTSFNGSADITTANWGTDRTITIGSTGKSVNGSANVSWSLAEIGAQPAGSYLTAEADTLQSVTTRGNSTTTGATFGGDLIVGNATSGNAIIELGQNRTANGFALIDLVGDTTYTDYGLRLIRFNTGANALSQLVHRGSGNLEIVNIDTAAIAFKTIDVERMRIASGGDIGINTTSPSTKLDVNGGVRLRDRLYDINNSAGASGYFLASTGSGTTWNTVSKASTPSSTGDTSGVEGNIYYDNTYLYIKTNAGWQRVLLEQF